MIWHPIASIPDIHQQPLMIASPQLIDGDANPLGISEGFWQDTDTPLPDGTPVGFWQTLQYDMNNDCWNTIELPLEAVTHYTIPTSPYTPEELAKHEATNLGGYAVTLVERQR